MENRLGVTNTVTAEQILPYLKENKLPECPSGGTYWFGSVTNVPTCSIPGHALPSTVEAPSVSTTTPTNQVAMNTINTISAMKQICLAMQMHAGEEDKLATNFDQITKYLPPGFSVDAFEIVSQAVLGKIIVRERTARRTPDGKWARVYGLFDGRAIEHISEDGNFDDWEKQQTVLSPSLNK